MAEVGDETGPKRAFGALDEEGGNTQNLQDRFDMLQVIRPRRAINQYVVKEYKYKPAQKVTEYVVHEALKGCGVRSSDQTASPRTQNGHGECGKQFSPCCLGEHGLGDSPSGGPTS